MSAREAVGVVAAILVITAIGVLLYVGAVRVSDISSAVAGALVMALVASLTWGFKPRTERFSARRFAEKREELNRITIGNQTKGFRIELVGTSIELIGAGALCILAAWFIITPILSAVPSNISLPWTFALIPYTLYTLGLFLIVLFGYALIVELRAWLATRGTPQTGGAGVAPAHGMMGDGGMKATESVVFSQKESVVKCLNCGSKYYPSFYELMKLLASSGFDNSVTCRNCGKPASIVEGDVPVQ